MLHDAVLPGARILGEPCPACGAELGYRATGAPLHSLRSVVRLADAYQEAIEGRDAVLRERLGAALNSVVHRHVWQNGQQVPCPYLHLSPWLLAQCREPQVVETWLEALKNWLPTEGTHT
ncbi:hypothetical protein EAO75_02040 [Streptomyces sp. uw30]|uniref:hypothetical protein n=1 Tax=Streptomyces sp. uw30 TaxID=1828179 RepID=UPI0011CECFB0|nr:hypothetical protein [Streptomyces sp. uw30]TXS53048.1 hypothetical protein EAO75_02040 [Streptomyces sp. uw30]